MTAPLPTQAYLVEITLTDAPVRCDYCGGPETAIAAVSWDPRESTRFGYLEACESCLPRVVDDAIADTYLDAEVTVEHFRFERTAA